MDSIYDNIRDTLEATKERSAWGRGVSAAMWSAEGRRYYRASCGGDAPC